MGISLVIMIEGCLILSAVIEGCFHNERVKLSCFWYLSNLVVLRVEVKIRDL